MLSVWFVSCVLWLFLFCLFLFAVFIVRLRYVLSYVSVLRFVFVWFVVGKVECVFVVVCI